MRWTTVAGAGLLWKAHAGASNVAISAVASRSSGSAVSGAASTLATRSSHSRSTSTADPLRSSLVASGGSAWCRPRGRSRAAFTQSAQLPTKTRI